jgi:aryl-alcohol dehydrogenase-like predicted oxidoreductase
MSKNKLVLGTAQFGMDYGINNKRGKIPREEVFKILKVAFESGIDTLDTAYTYGESEAVIGDFTRISGFKLKIISKLPVCSLGNIENLFETSINRLRLDSLYGYYMHSFQHYLETPEVWSTLTKMKSEGKVTKIGFSLYYPSELDYILDHNIPLDIVQVPYSIFDQRFSSYFPKLRDKKVEVFVRSVFLQGLGFKDPSELSAHFENIKNKIVNLRKLSKDIDAPLSSIFLNFAVLNEYINKVVVGIDNIENLWELLASSDYLCKVDPIMTELASFKEDDEKIILPVNWR